MKKYDVRFSQGFCRSHSWRYQQRVEAKNEQSAINKIIKQCKKERPNEKVMNVRVKEAEDYICWTYNSIKLSDGTFGFKKEYYSGYIDLRPFGMGVEFTEKQNEAKKFETEHLLKQEIKAIGRKVSEYKIERIKVL